MVLDLWIKDMDIICGHHHLGFGKVMGFYPFFTLNDITINNPNNAILRFYL